MNKCVIEMMLQLHSAKVCEGDPIKELLMSYLILMLRRMDFSFFLARPAIDEVKDIPTRSVRTTISKAST